MAGVTDLVWFRHDLRLDDHPAIAAAVGAARRRNGAVAGCFVVDPSLWRHEPTPRQGWVAASVDCLDGDMGRALIVRHGEPGAALSDLARHLGASRVHVTAATSPAGRARDRSVAARLGRVGVALVTTGTAHAVAPGVVRTRQGHPYRVFTPFRRTWEPMAIDAPVATPEVAWTRVTTGSDRVASDLIAGSVAACPSPWRPGAAAATTTLERFIDRHLAGYDTDRDVPGVDATSRLSPHLKVGSIHPRTVLAAVAGAPPGDGPAAFVAELGWREFMADQVWHSPERLWRNDRADLDAMAVDTDTEARRRFERWCAGDTGFPLVDAGMRQLAAQGWMHNRVRMVAASFLVKDLHLPWQWGARWFLHHLVDGDPASNNGGWKWVAGTGSDAAPYHRVFNPWTQSSRFDPDAAYIRRWVPELSEADPADIHAGTAAFTLRGVTPPMVDHAIERREALARLAAARSPA